MNVSSGRRARVALMLIQSILEIEIRCLSSKIGSRNDQWGRGRGRREGEGRRYEKREVKGDRERRE